MTAPSDDAIHQALRGTLIDGRPIESIAIAQSDQVARWIPGDHGRLSAAWPAVRDAVVAVGFWPVLSDVEQARTLSRASFPVPDDRPWSERRVDPKPGRSLSSILDDSAAIDERSALRAFRAMRDRRDAANLADPARLLQTVERARSTTEQTLGRAPTIDEALAGIGPSTTRAAIERWFLDWEEANRSKEIAVPFEIYEPQWAGILLLPTPRPWEVFAHLSWFGAEGELVAPMIVLARTWYERFGAEVRSQTGTWMDFVVGTPPRTLDEAFGLADEQDLVAADTAIDLGIWTVRGLARHLVDRPSWVLSARP